MTLCGCGGGTRYVCVWVCDDDTFCSAPKITAPVAVHNRFPGGMLSLRVGHPGAHMSTGAPQSYNVHVDLARLLSPVSMSINIDRQVLCPACQGTGATHSSRLHTCGLCNGTGVAASKHGDVDVAACCPGPHTMNNNTRGETEDEAGAGTAFPSKQERTPRSCFQQSLEQTCPRCGGHGRVVQVGAECPRCGGHRTVRIKDAVRLAFPPGSEDGTRCVFPRKVRQCCGCGLWAVGCGLWAVVAVGCGRGGRGGQVCHVTSLSWNRIESNQRQGNEDPFTKCVGWPC